MGDSGGKKQTVSGARGDGRDGGLVGTGGMEGSGGKQQMVSGGSWGREEWVAQAATGTFSRLCVRSVMGLWL